MSQEMPAVAAQSPVPEGARNSGLTSPNSPIEPSMPQVVFPDQGRTGPAARFAHGGGDQSPLTVPPVPIDVAGADGACHCRVGYEVPLPGLHPNPPAVVSPPSPSESTAAGVKAGPNDYSVVLT